MNFIVPWIDLRHQGSGQTTITESETGKIVGLFSYSHGSRRRTVSLFDGKYVGSFETHEECDAFAKGVASVLRHMTHTGSLE